MYSVLEDNKRAYLLNFSKIEDVKTYFSKLHGSSNLVSVDKDEWAFKTNKNEYHIKRVFFNGKSIFYI